MNAADVLVTLRLAKPVRRRGFCPACWADLTVSPGPTPGIVPASDAITVAIVLGVAAVAAAVTVWQMLGMEMGMGLGGASSFAATWTVMMAAMMLPSATPLVYRFAQRADGRPMRTVAVATLGAVYLAIWLAFGVGSYVVYNAVGMPWQHQAVVGGGALVLAAVYALTPMKRRSQNRCREVCALHGPLPFNLVRAGAVDGWRYGLSCLGCSAGLMVAMVLIGMPSLVWTFAVAALVLAYKFAPLGSWRLDAILATVVAALGIVYTLVT